MYKQKWWELTCKTCSAHKLNVTRVWTILAGPGSESWQEWGPIEADHHWHHEPRSLNSWQQNHVLRTGGDKP